METIHSGESPCENAAVQRRRLTTADEEDRVNVRVWERLHQ
jgi:hypothetical protein